MFNRFLTTVLLLVLSSSLCAQIKHYTTANAHSHNDYEQKHPFYSAWQNKFGSIEADIWLKNGRLIVAHDSSEIDARRTIESLYLNPLRKIVAKNAGNVYTEQGAQLQLMIDIKTEALPTLRQLVETLKKFPVLTSSATLKIVISGNKPAPSMFNDYPAWIFFDGELKKVYDSSALSKIAMLSDDFADYSTWKGTGTLPAKDKIRLQQMIEKAHSSGKKIRFWNAPDNSASWKILMELGVDYLNTDKIEELTHLFKN